MTLDELYKILTSDIPSKGIVENEERVFEFIPKLKECKNFSQNSVWHVYDVYEHILHVLDGVDNILPLRLAALFHDVGKPDTYFEDDKGGHFPNHWVVSREAFREFAEKNNIDLDTQLLVSKLIFYHDISIDKLTDDGVRQLLEVFTKEELKMLFNLKRADLLAQNSEYHYLLNNYDKQENALIKKYI